MIDIELLGRAYPQGFLPATGTNTIGGWHCSLHQPATEDEQGLIWFCHATPAGVSENFWFNLSTNEVENELLKSALENGDLLPKLDCLEDPLTWEAAKIELWNSLKLTNIYPASEFSWHVTADATWYLSALSFNSIALGAPHNTPFPFQTLDELDPVVALVKAQAQVRN